MTSIAEQICYVGRLMFERNLTDIAGGNITMRESDTIYCTPRYAGNRWHWQLNPENIVVGPVLTDELLSNPSFTREGLSHLAIYRAFPFVRAIIHAHPRHILPFVAFERPLSPVLKATRKFGTLKYISQAPNFSREQADSIVENLRGQDELMHQSAAALLMPQHGIILAGVKILDVLDSLERIDTNAYCLITESMLPDPLNQEMAFTGNSKSSDPYAE
jgi:ribulose-5-phosphate 4-epimerase/fuculose-1-phosphate aldolase